MKTLLLFFSLLPIATGLVCRSDYTLINGKICLKYFPTPVTHWNAELTCKSHGGTLVTAKNAVDNRAIASLANAAGASEIWIGLYSYSNNTSYNFWDDYNNTPGGWTNLYNNFMPENPVVTTGRCSVMEVASSFGANMGKWKSVPCNNQNSPSIRSYPYVCEVPPTYPTSPCDVNYNGNCYWRSKNLGTGQNLDITQAATACAQRGAGFKLVSIHSKMETDFIKLLYKGTDTKVVYIGAKLASAPNNYTWLDGSDWDFNYVNPLDFSSKQCLVMDVSPNGNGLWTSTDCTNQLDFLCKKKISPATLPEKTSVLPKMGVSAQPQVSIISNCDQSYIMAPSEIATNPALATPTTNCKFGIHALGAYKLGIFFDFWVTYGTLDIYDEFGNNVGHFGDGYIRPAFSVIMPSNFATMVFTKARYISGQQMDRGFTAVALPL